MNFFNQFLEQNRTVGAVAPSSKFLVKKMLAPVDFKKAKVIVEFGPGTGIITRALLKKMLPDALLFSFEINKEFTEYLSSINDRRLILLNKSAEKLSEELKNHAVHQSDYIISSIPLVNIPAKIENRILLTAYESLKEGGKFIQFQYSLTSQRKLKKIFGDVEVDFTPLNIPPAFIYVCTK